eukprot:GHRR01028163.1.p1 GENE.GHRR01028163.1~~GHRR01028163.1.p1  ORF type:complete len:260 (+),score=87.16 GHRR01028163.1:78-857(+)
MLLCLADAAACVVTAAKMQILNLPKHKVGAFASKRQAQKPFVAHRAQSCGSDGLQQSQITFAAAPQQAAAKRRSKRAATLVVAAAAAAEKVEQLTIQPIKTISGTVKLPGSKSLSNRILLLAALAEGTTVVKNLLDSDDIRFMVGALKALGIQMEEKWEEGVMVVQGCGGKFPVEGAELFLGNAGTAMRPLTAAVAAASRGRFVLDGVARMRERPIQDLVDGLVQLGVDAKCTLGTGCPPVEINAQGLPSGTVSRLFCG